MIFLTLFCIFATLQRVFSLEIHELHYIYTALSKPIRQPGVYQFAAMGILNGRPIDFYNSTDKIKMPLQKWMEEHNERDHSLKGTQSRRRMEQWFDFSIKILKEHMRQNKPDVHILQWMHGCRVENTTDGKLKFLKGFHQYGYDGEDFLAFDSKNMVWVAHVPAAESTKQKWDDESILSQYTKEYLETDCVHWLEKLLKYQEQDFRTFSPPEVYLFSKKTTRPDYQTLVCLATGFYPKDVVVDILKNGVPLAGVNSSEVRPNGERKETYQLRKWLEIKASDTSKYSCRIQHRTLPVPIEESWDGKCRNCDGDNTGAIVGGVVVLLIVLVTVPVVLYILRRRINAAQAAVIRLRLPLTEVNPETKSSNNYVESGDSGWEFTVSDEPIEVTKSLMANAAQAHVNRLNQPLNEVNRETKGSACSVESEDSGRGSTASPGPKEEGTEPLMVDGQKPFKLCSGPAALSRSALAGEEGEQQPQLEAVEEV